METIENKILSILEKENKTQRELREELKISKSYLSEILGRMEKKRLIKRERISQRTVLISINREKIIKIGILKATEYAAIFLTARDLKDYRINLIAFNNGLEVMKSLMVGEIDIACAPIITGFIFHLMDRRIAVLSACAGGGSGIVYNKKSGVIGSTLLSTMDIQSRNFLTYFEGIKYFLSPEEMVESLEKNDVNAISIWEPYLSIFKGRKKIIMGKEDPCCGFLILRDNINIAIKEIHNKFLENTYFLSMGKRIEEAGELMGEFFKMDTSIIIESLKNYKFSNELNEDHIVNMIKRIGIDVNINLINNYLNKI